VTTAVGLGTVLSFLFNAATPPLTWFATCYLLMLAGLNGSRASYRMLQESWKRSRGGGEPVLIYGAGRAGTAVVRELLSQAEASFRPVGFIDDHGERAGKVFNGYPVLGSVETLPAVIVQHGVKGVIVATKKLPPERLHAAALACEQSRIWIRHFRIRFEDETGHRATHPIPALRR
jgi:FlaA1/EpsC-like NDP-sugar epimerase